MEDRAPRDADLHGEDRAAAVVRDAERDVIAVGDLSGERDASEREARVRARVKAQLERADLGDDGIGAGRALDVVEARLGQPRGAAERHRGARSIDPSPGERGDRRDVERVIEVGVTDDDGVGARRVRGDRPSGSSRTRGMSSAKTPRAASSEFGHGASMTARASASTSDADSCFRLSRSPGAITASDSSRAAVRRDGILLCPPPVGLAVGIRAWRQRRVGPRRADSFPR